MIWHNVLPDTDNTNHHLYTYSQHLSLLFLDPFENIRTLSDTPYQAQAPNRKAETKGDSQQWYRRLGTKGATFTTRSHAILIG